TALLSHVVTVIFFFVLSVGQGPSQNVVVLSCRVDHTSTPPFGVYLKRSRLRPGDVLFKYEDEDVSVRDGEYHNRTSVTGDPKIHEVNVTIRDLRPTDTDQYHCEFNFNNPTSEDTVQRGTTEYFIYVRGGETHNTTQHTTHNIQHTTYNTQHTTQHTTYNTQHTTSKATPNPAPIYEEMTGLKPKSPKRSRGFGDELPWASEYRNITPKDEREPRPENHYESPNGAIESKPE
uniref:Immunoglobulin V-set domain-containing protein n=1 Tax=Periophthalmus magnuspinnatus TaxID=409849 RepID=A0A3B4AK58_9GOBI